MNKRLTASILAFALALALCAPALANPANTYYKLGFTQPRPVYTGPGYDYYRANGNATYGGGGAQYYGTDTETGWLLIGYRTGKGLWRMGYVTPDSQYMIRPTDTYTLFDITFEHTPAHTTVSCVITDDPLMDLHTPLATLPANHNVEVLCKWSSGWTYVETHVQDLGTMRGFIRPSNLADGAAPWQEPVMPPAGEWLALYRDYLQTHNYEYIYDLELIDIDFDGTPELLVNYFTNDHSYQFDLLSIFDGTLKVANYYSLGYVNEYWVTEQRTNSHLQLYLDQQTGRYVWLAIDSETITGSTGGRVSEVSLYNGQVTYNDVFSFSHSLPDNPNWDELYFIQGSPVDRASFLSMLDTYKAMHTLYTAYVPCYAEASMYNAAAVLDSLAATWNNYTRYLMPQY